MILPSEAITREGMKGRKEAEQEEDEREKDHV